jgi:hypothetical protein
VVLGRGGSGGELTDPAGVSKERRDRRLLGSMGSQLEIKQAASTRATCETLSPSLSSDRLAA